MAIPISDYDKLEITRISDGDGNDIPFSYKSEGAYYRYVGRADTDAPMLLFVINTLTECIIISVNQLLHLVLRHIRFNILNLTVTFVVIITLFSSYPYLPHYTYILTFLVVVI